MFHKIWMVVVLACVLPTVASGAPKPEIAILGLEVITQGGKVDSKATGIANTLTDELRQAATRSNGPYKIAPNSDKDLLEMKLLSDCSTERRRCMVKMGKELGADRLLYGYLQRGEGGYSVVLNLLNIQTSEMERTTTDIIGADSLHATGLRRWGRILYGRLANVLSLGALIVYTNADKGVVYVDGQAKGKLQGGTFKLTRIDVGRHRLIVEAEGYVKYAESFQIASGETYETNIRLVTEGGASKTPTVSRGLFWVTLTIAGASAAAMTVAGLQVRGSLADKKNVAISVFNANHPDSPLDVKDACEDAKSRNVIEAVAVRDACDKGKSRARLANVFLGATIVSAVAAGYFYYRGYMARSSVSVQDANKSSWQLSPSLGPTHVGAGLQFDF